MAKLKLTINGQEVYVDESFKELTPGEQDKTVEEIASNLGPSPSKREPYTGTGSLAKGALDMASFGFDDEIYATVSDLLGGNYDEDVAQYRKEKEQAQEDHPFYYAGGQIAGGLPAMLVPGMNIARGGSLLGTIGRSAVTGLATGEAYGIGSSEGDIGTRAVEGVPEALAGGVAGAIAPGLLALVGGAARGTGRAARTIGSMATRGAIRSNAEKDGLDYVANILKESGGVDRAVSEAERLGMPVGFANETTRHRVGQEVSSLAEPIRSETVRKLDDMLATSKAEVNSAMRVGSGSADQNPFMWKDQFIDDMAQRGSREYNKIWATNPRPSVRSSLTANAILRDDKTLIRTVKAMMPAGTFDPENPVRTLEEVEVIRRALKKLGGGNTPAAAMYREQERQLRQILDADHLDLAAVRKQWADKSEMDRAFDEGAKGVNRDSNLIERNYEDLSDVGKPLWQKGMYSDVNRQLNDTYIENMSLTRKLKTPGGKKTMNLVTGGNSEAAVRAIEKFEAVADVRKWTKTVSAPDPKGGSNLRSVSFGAWALANLVSNNPLSAVQHANAAIAFLPKSLTKLPPEQQKVVIRTMLKTDPATVKKAMKNFMYGNEEAKLKWQRRFNNLFIGSVKNSAIRSASPLEITVNPEYERQ